MGLSVGFHKEEFLMNVGRKYRAMILMFCMDIAYQWKERVHGNARFR
jgi:hypothetical protein